MTMRCPQCWREMTYDQMMAHSPRECLQEPEDQMPHCDSYVLHAPQTCTYCDGYPWRQRGRREAKILFTGEGEREGWIPCPSQLRRPLESIQQWPGNRPTTPGESP